MTPPTNPSKPAEVIQADREAAAKLYEWFPSLSSTPDEAQKTAAFILSGGADGWNTVHSYRDHRLAHQPPVDQSGLREALKEAASALDWAARAMKGNCSGSDVNAMMLAAGRATDARTALASIRSGDAG